VKTPLSFQQKAQCWTRRYEQLREQVLTGDNSIATDRRGLTVLIAEGRASEKDGLSLHPAVHAAPGV
jgi:hypothetical protein